VPSVRRVPDAQWRWWVNTPESTLFMPHLEHGVATFMLQVGGRRIVDQDLAGDEDTFLQWTQREQYEQPVQVLVGDAADELPNLYFVFHGALYEVEREQVPLTGEIDEIFKRVVGALEEAPAAKAARARVERKGGAKPAAKRKAAKPAARKPAAKKKAVKLAARRPAARAKPKR